MSKKIKVLFSKEGYDLAAQGYDKKEKYLDSFEKGKFLSLLSENLKGKVILDVGAGTGRVSLPLFFAGGQVTALDVSEKILEVLKKKNSKIKTVVGDAEALPFEKNIFDIVTAAFLVVHLKDPTRFFDEVYRVLKPGGLFLVTNINQKEPPVVKTGVGDIQIKSYYHRPDKIREILSQLAFVIEKEEMIYENEVWVNQIILAKK
ncbi:MAG TPA: class I SAM-dependent methyltransferase [Candidatus Magasanikbacteria bacterium]|nr:class I SAM-dependent methyltransferase [Candidatus Magasanikbacteria bacterium]